MLLMILLICSFNLGINMYSLITYFKQKKGR